MTKSRYPKNWDAIALAYKQAANWQCAHCGKVCRRPDESLADFLTRTPDDPKSVTAHPQRWALTVAHLNHDPENLNADLVALCVPCHRRYDNAQMAKIKQKKREAHGQLRLDQAPPVALEGMQLALDDLAEPQAVANAQAGVRWVTVATLVDWMRGHLDQVGADLDPVAYLQQVQPGAPLHATHFANLCEWVPYRSRFRQEDLQAACTQLLQDLTQPPAQARYRPLKRIIRKGHASGWIEERTGNHNRKSPSLSYYYRWDSPAGRVTEYIRSNKVATVSRMLDANRPALEVLQVVVAGRKVTGVTARVLSEAPCHCGQLT